MALRLMTLATVLMLLASLMIGATLALARTAHAEVAKLCDGTAQRNSASCAKLPLSLQADPDSPKRPYQETLAAMALRIDII